MRQLTYLAMQTVGHACGYMRRMKNEKPIEYDEKTMNACGKCALTGNYCVSPLNQDAHECPIFKKTLERLTVPKEVKFK